MSINFKPCETWVFQGRELKFERHLGGDLLHFTEQRTLTPLLVESDEGIHRRKT